MLDVACGTGIVARRAAPLVGRSGRVVGLDPSPGMLVVARSASGSEGVTVEWQEGTVETLPFPESSFHLVLRQMGMQFFPDKVAALAEMRRVLTSGGRLVLAVWQGFDRHPVWSTLNEAMRKHLGIPALEIPFSLGGPGTPSIAERCRLLGHRNRAGLSHCPLP